MSLVRLDGTSGTYAVQPSDVGIAYVGVSTGCTAALPATSGSQRSITLMGWRLSSPSNAMLVQPAVSDVIGSGVAGVGIALTGGTSYIQLYDFVPGQWVILSRSKNLVTPTQSGLTYLIAATDDFVPCNSAAPTLVTLPAAPIVGETHVVLDATGNAATNNLTVAGNGNTINGAATVVISKNWGAATFVWVGASVGWNAY